MSKRITTYLAILGIVAAVFLVKRVRHTDPPAPPLAEPARAPFEHSIGARGIVESMDENVRIAPAVAGLVSKVKVKVGDHVKTGDILLELDTRDATATVAAQESQLVSTRAQIDEATVQIADKKDQWERMEKLSANSVASIDERQRARFAVETATAKLASARGGLQQMESQVERAKVQVDLLSIRAPRDGTVLQVNIREGEYAQLSAKDPILLLGQIDQLQLRADVDEDNASRVRPGCAAIAYIKGRREFPIDLKFVRIEPYILPKQSLTGESSERVDTRVLQVIFHFSKPGLPVYVGQQMDVFLDAGGQALRRD